MVHFKPLFVALAAVSTVVARPPCRPDTTAPTMSATTTAEETTSTETSTTETYATETSTTIVSTTTTNDETFTTAAPTTTTTESDVSTTSTAPETTTSAPAPVCGVTGYFVPGHDMTYLYSPGYKLSAKECLEGCAAYSGCEVIAFYYTGSSIGRCEYFKGPLITDGEPTPYKWYDVGCLAEM
ncbi:uncharacterized protein NECHADRAFT_78407 [Fusarium vanettenii 77-13-4]|uniref:Apple domain-containing protein n=1 Tax=Fusarium vanettenii (strain ATCC MYA-4622 / CBS 123669 / FGSC 9596 / NRRL 45880 / 77-13-4) TaxID=660122 RepID=C7ZFB5_FUSV7|nr:uncharacterized protein NECHADRAFT_78407 [Fusarium vanettenii 77-13-4]EEU37289.1 predicted protein [Fusarium vanettenii 77-13-4]